MASRFKGEDYAERKRTDLKIVNLCQFLIYNLITFKIYEEPQARLFVLL